MLVESFLLQILLWTERFLLAAYESLSTRTWSWTKTAQHPKWLPNWKDPWLYMHQHSFDVAIDKSHHHSCTSHQISVTIERSTMKWNVNFQTIFFSLNVTYMMHRTIVATIQQTYPLHSLWTSVGSPSCFWIESTISTIVSCTIPSKEATPGPYAFNAFVNVRRSRACLALKFCKKTPSSITISKGTMILE